MRRTVLLGMDGIDPAIVEEMMSSGLLPNFERMAARGGYGHLATLDPPQSPVVWTTIATGTGPGRHGVFDFIHRDPSDYRLFLSLQQAEGGRFVNPVRRTTFWEETGGRGRPVTVLKWPMGFPPRPFPGRLLAGLGVPDLGGKLGSYSFYTSSPALEPPSAKGRIIPVAVRGGEIHTEIAGPRVAGPGGGRTASTPLSIRLGNQTAEFSLGRRSFTLAPGQWSPWVPVPFDAGFFRTVTGWCRFRLQGLSPDFSLYLTPVNLPGGLLEMPISHPRGYAEELASAIGPYATLGMAEDTDAVDDGVLDDGAFVELCDGVMGERERMFLHELARFREGLLACVFDTTDRIQHMFWRTRDPGHPLFDQETAERHGDVIPRYYRWVDRIAGLVMEMAPDAALLCCSDHGFQGFRRAVHLNTLLAASGYLAIKPGRAGCEGLFACVDWHRTRAYAVGFSGVYLNLRGREGRGVVPQGEAEALKRELQDLLERFEDGGSRVFRKVHDAALLYGNGAVASAGPDLVTGCAPGYRASWETAVGGVPAGPVVVDNSRKWSGDHLCDAGAVPGVFLCHQTGGRNVREVGDIAREVERLTS